MEEKTVNSDDTLEILEIITDLISNLDIDVILNKIGSSAGRLVLAEGASVMLFDDEKQYLRFIAASGEKAHILRRITVTEGVAWDVAQSRFYSLPTIPCVVKNKKPSFSQKLGLCEQKCRHTR